MGGGAGPGREMISPLDPVNEQVCGDLLWWGERLHVVVVLLQTRATNMTAISYLIAAGGGRPCGQSMDSGDREGVDSGDRDGAASVGLQLCSHIHGLSCPVVPVC